MGIPVLIHGNFWEVLGVVLLLCGLAFVLLVWAEFHREIWGKFL